VALDLIDPEAIAQAKIISGDTLATTRYLQLKKQGDSDLTYLKLLDYDSDGQQTGDLKYELEDDDYAAYVAWKNAHLLMCQHPSMNERFPQ
jgi:hypothetical protein